MGGVVRASIVLGLACGACGILSGLDSLSTSDGGAEIDAAGQDGAPPGDATMGADVSDGAMGADSPIMVNDTGTLDSPSSSCEYTGGDPHCYPTTCPDADICCVTGGPTSPPTCVAPTSCSGVQLGCTAPSDCASGQKCCFADVGSIMSGCPSVVVPTTTTKTSCATSCVMATWRLCTVDTDCASGHTCHQAYIQGAPAEQFGLCN